MSIHTVTIKRNSSLRASILLAVEGLPRGPYQIQCLTHPTLLSGGVQRTLLISKIRVSYDQKQSRWRINEFVLALDGEAVPTSRKGDYNLVEDFEARLY